MNVDYSSSTTSQYEYHHGNCANSSYTSTGSHWVKCIEWKKLGISINQVDRLCVERILEAQKCPNKRCQLFSIHSHPSSATQYVESTAQNLCWSIHLMGHASNDEWRQFKLYHKLVHVPLQVAHQCISPYWLPSYTSRIHPSNMPWVECGSLQLSKADACNHPRRTYPVSRCLALNKCFPRESHRFMSKQQLN